MADPGSVEATGKARGLCRHWPPLLVPVRGSWGPTQVAGPLSRSPHRAGCSGWARCTWSPRCPRGGWQGRDLWDRLAGPRVGSPAPAVGAAVSAASTGAHGWPRTPGRGPPPPGPPPPAPAALRHVQGSGERAVQDSSPPRLPPRAADTKACCHSHLPSCSLWGHTKAQTGTRELGCWALGLGGGSCPHRHQWPLKDRGGAPSQGLTPHVPRGMHRTWPWCFGDS